METNTNVNASSSSGKNDGSYLAKRIYDIEERIQKEQNKPPKKNKTFLSIISMIGAFGCIIASFLVMDYASDLPFVLLLAGGALLGVSIWSGGRENRASKSKQTTINSLQKELEGLLVVDKKSIDFYLDCSERIKNGGKTTEVLSIIGQKYGYRDLSSAQKFYEKGEQEIIKQKIIDKYKKEKSKL